MTPIVIPMEDDLVHTAEHPYCDDETCPCQAELRQAWAELQAVPSYIELEADAFASEK